MSERRLGRPRTRGRVRRITLELEYGLMAKIDRHPTDKLYRQIFEEALQLWLDKQREAGGDE